MIRLGVILAFAGTLLAQMPDPERIFQEAIAAEQRGDDATALKQYQDLVRAHPEAVVARVNLGATLVRLGRFDEAIDQYRAALKLQPGNAHARFNLALAYREKGALQPAAAELELLRKSEPAAPEPAMLLGDCYARMARYADAVSVLAPLEPSRMENLDLEWLLGSALIHAGRAQEGLERIEKVADRAPSAEAHLLAGETRLQRAEYDLARHHAAEALRLNPELPGALTLHGMVLEHLGDYEASEAMLRQALRVDDKDFNAHLYLGAILYFKRDLVAARAQLERALALEPASPRARYELALVARQQGRLGEAVGDLETAARQTPDWLLPHVELVALYFRLQRPADGAREKRTVDRLMVAQQQRGPGLTP